MAKSLIFLITYYAQSQEANQTCRACQIALKLTYLILRKSSIFDFKDTSEQIRKL